MHVVGYGRKSLRVAMKLINHCVMNFPKIRDQYVFCISI